ncbi:MAG: prepilin-type N-terminal cleavage/methylation domain-containing protein [Xanthomonadales bacterium]|nr:prepilin-type N-terminal cleavage/methylation domain-containing protein [Xanthomonadales bacterium]
MPFAFTLHNIKSKGFSLIELMIGMTLGSFLLLGIIASFSAASAAFIAISDRYELLQNASRGLRFISTASREAGFPNLTDGNYPVPISASSQKSAGDDILILEGWSRQNCFGNANPSVDSDNRPGLFFRVQRFQRTNDSLRWRCGYGSNSSSLVIQSNNQTIINNVSAFRVRYFEDSNLDGSVDRAVNAGDWTTNTAIQQLEITLLLHTDSNKPESITSFRSIVRLRNAG